MFQFIDKIRQLVRSNGNNHIFLNKFLFDDKNRGKWKWKAIENFLIDWDDSLT